MSENADVIIIGAGVIGGTVAFELAKRGYKTLSIDKLPTAGYGSTSNSCAIVRAHHIGVDYQFKQLLTGYRLSFCGRELSGFTPPGA